MKKKIVMAAGDGTFNLGDEAVIASFLKNLRALTKDVEVTIFSCNPKRTSKSHNVKSIKMDMSVFGVVKGLFTTIKTCSKMDLLVWGGGNLIIDESSQLYTPFHLIKVLLAKLMGKKVIVYAIGVGPLNGALGKFLTRAIINHVDIITVRDEESKKILENVGITKPLIYVTADPAFDLKSAKELVVRKILKEDGIIKEEKQPLIAIVPRRVFHRKSKFLFSSIIPIKYKVKFGLIDKKSKIKFEKFEKTLAMAADYLVDKINARIVFIPMQMSAEQQQQDDKISAEIIQKMKHKKNACMINSYKYSIQELKGIYGQMDLVIGVRFHAIILSASMNVPVVSLPYSQKGKRLTKRLGLEKYSIPVEKVEYKNLVEKIEKVLSDKSSIKRNLKEKTKILQEKAKFNVKLVYDMLR